MQSPELESNLLQTIYIPKNLMHLKDKLPKASYTKDFKGILGKKAPEQSKSMVLPLQTLKISKTIENDIDPDSA